MTDLSQIRESIVGSRIMGTYVNTDTDHARGLVSALATLKTQAGVSSALTGTNSAPASFPPVTTIHDDLVGQVSGRWLCKGDGHYRNVPEMWQQISNDLAVLSDTSGSALSGWKPLPVFNQSQSTGERSSHQSGVPSWQSDGMHVFLPARGGSNGPGASSPSGNYQRCEEWVAGATDLTGRLFMRYDFTLKSGFPTGTSTWQSISQCKNDSTGSPPLELMIGNSVVYLQWHNSGGSETGRETLGQASTGVKHFVVLDITFSSEGGNVSGWMDGKPSFTNVNHGPTLYSGQSSYQKIGIYRDASVNQDAEIVWHSVVHGGSFAEVA